MSSIESDLEIYRVGNECKQKWELRKKFISAHKENLPIDKLICYSQVLLNIEYMGCKYPQPLMNKIEELSKGIVEDFRAIKNCDASKTSHATLYLLSAKILGTPDYVEIIKRKVKAKGRKAIEKIQISENVTTTEVTETEVKSSGVTSENIDKVSEKDDGTSAPASCTPSTDTAESHPQASASLIVSESLAEALKTEPVGVNLVKPIQLPLKQLELLPNTDFSNIVLFIDRVSCNPFAIVNKTASWNEVPLRWEFPQKHVAHLYLNNKLISAGKGSSISEAQKDAAGSCIDLLMQNSFTVFEKVRLGTAQVKAISEKHGRHGIRVWKPSDIVLYSTNNTNDSPDFNKDKHIERCTCIVCKHYSFNPKSHIIIVKPDDRWNIELPGKPIENIEARFENYLRQWFAAPGLVDIFLRDAIRLHQNLFKTVLQMKVKINSRCGGRGNRFVVLTKKLKPWDMIRELIVLGGSNYRYQLVYPNRYEFPDEIWY